MEKQEKREERWIERIRTEILIYRWSLTIAGLIACFWTIWYLIAGEVPTLNEIKLTSGKKVIIFLKLPFEISRWWDILMGPIWSIYFTKFLYYRYRTLLDEYKDITCFCLFIIPFLGLVIGLIWGLIYGLLSTLCGAIPIIILYLINKLLYKETWLSFGKWISAQ